MRILCTVLYIAAGTLPLIAALSAYKKLSASDENRDDTIGSYFDAIDDFLISRLPDFKLEGWYLLGSITTGTAASILSLWA